MYLNLYNNNQNMPQRKKQKGAKNGFYYFMLEIQKREKQKGNNYPLNYVSELASPEWSEMSAEQRKPYNDMAASYAAKSNDDMTKKFTSLGISYADLDAEQREIEEARNLMIATIKNTIARLDRESDLKKHVFFVCHVNYYYKMEHYIYQPAEIAMAAFSLENGILATLHFFVDPGEIPLGFKYEASDWSTRTHGIPITDKNWKEGVKEPIEMYRRVKFFIKKFMDGTGQVPPIYTMFDTLNGNSRHTVVKSALNMMCEAANEDSSLFRVYCLSHLFYELRNKCSAFVPSVAIMKNELDKDVFSYARELGCYFHEEKDISIYCSLSMVTRWVFTICDHCCRHLGIELSLGRHVPKDTDLSGSGKTGKNKNCSSKQQCVEDQKKPLTIIDHGYLKEQRAEEKRVVDVHLQESENIRFPKLNYSSKIGARFGQDVSPCGSSSSSSEGNDLPNEDGWLGVKTKPAIGRGRGIFKDTSPDQPVWPVSGRGRAFSSVPKFTTYN